MSEIKVCVSIPTAGTVHALLAHSLVALFGKVAATGIETLPDTTVEIGLDIVASSNWITNRELALKRAIDHGFTHLVFIDDDMSFEPNILDVMLGRRQSVVVTNYLIKDEAKNKFVAVTLDDKRLITKEKSTGLHEVAYSGFGFSVFELAAIKDVPQPWFLPKFNPEVCEYTTEDNPYFEKLREHGLKIYCDQDASKLVTHHGRSTWRYNDFVGVRKNGDS